MSSKPNPCGGNEFCVAISLNVDISKGDGCSHLDIVRDSWDKTFEDLRDIVLEIFGPFNIFKLDEIHYSSIQKYEPLKNVNLSRIL